MHTEEKAKQLWCPMGRVAAWNDEQGNSFPSPLAVTDNSVCKASGCAMWRWTLSPEGAATQNARSNAGAVAKGYCGLAVDPLF